MAKVGFEFIYAAKLDERVSKSFATARYYDGREIGPGASVNGSPTSNDVKDYGDDRAVETDTSVTGGTISLELNEPTMENDAFLLGHTVREDGGMVRNTNDIAPFAGIGFVGKSRRNNATIFKTKIYLKTQFREPNDENQTKQETITFSHTTYEGSMYQLENGDWKDEKEFKTLAEAKKYILSVLADGASVPAQTKSMGEKNKNVKVSDLIDSDAAIKWDGTKGTVTGTAKKDPESAKALYDADEKEGHFFPVMFEERYFGKKITLSGTKNPNKTITLSVEDPYLIIRLENLSDGKMLTATLQETGEEVFVLDFSGVTLAEAA